MTALTHISAPLAQLTQLMEAYPCYAFVVNEDCTGAKALFRGQWSWEAVAEYLGAQPTAVVTDDERASGYIRYRLYGELDGCLACLAEVEVYLARGRGRQEKQFWCKTAQRAGYLGLAA